MCSIKSLGSSSLLLGRGLFELRLEGEEIDECFENVEFNFVIYEITIKSIIQNHEEKRKKK